MGRPLRHRKWSHNCALASIRCNLDGERTEYFAAPVLLTINTISALITIASAVLALCRPGLMVHASSVDANTRFYVYMYAVRAIPAGIAVLIAPFYFRGGSVVLLLATFAVIQAGDAFIGWTRKEWGMVLFPSISAAVHMVVALSVPSV